MTVLSIDFDGTIIEDGHYPDIGPAIPGAIESVNKLYDVGYCIIINSCRSYEDEQNMIKWLCDNNVKFCHVNTNCRHVIDEYGVDCRKISAHVYIDNRNLDAQIYPLPWDVIVHQIFSLYGTHADRKCQMGEDDD